MENGLQVAERFWRTETGFFLGIWLFFMVGARGRLFRDPGTFWHTVVGRRILGTCRFFDTDPFSFSRAGQLWVPHQWLGECVMGLLDELGGLDTLLLATATALAVLYTWVAHRLLRSGLHWLPTLLLTMLSVAASANHLHARPHLATIVFFGLTYGWLCDFENGRAGLERLAWLVPVFWVWSNMHGGALAGLATMIMALAGWCMFRLVGLDSPVVSVRQVVRLTILIVACGLTSVLNPYGTRLPRAWMEIMRSPVVARLIEEHARLDPRSPEAWLILSFALIYLGVLASLRPWRPRVMWLLPLFWWGQTFLRVRHSPLFSIASVLAMAELLPHSRLAAFLARPGRDLFRFSSVVSGQERVGSGQWAVGSEDESTKAGQWAGARSWIRCDWGPAALPLVLVLLAAVFQATGVKVPILGRGWVRLDPTHWPVELLPELEQAEREHPQGSGIFNDFLYGGFLIYYTPGLKVFIDDRCELYGDDRLMQFSEAMQSRPERIEEWQREYNFGYAIVASGTPFDRYLDRSPDWIVVKRTDTATFFKCRIQ
jgi:hypothetical protein